MSTAVFCNWMFYAEKRCRAGGIGTGRPFVRSTRSRPSQKVEEFLSLPQPQTVDGTQREAVDFLVTYGDPGILKLSLDNRIYTCILVGM